MLADTAEERQRQQETKQGQARDGLHDVGEANEPPPQTGPPRERDCRGNRNGRSHAQRDQHQPDVFERERPDFSREPLIHPASSTLPPVPPGTRAPRHSAPPEIPKALRSCRCFHPSAARYGWPTARLRERRESRTAPSFSWRYAAPKTVSAVQNA